MRREEPQTPERTNAEELAEEDRAAVPYSTGYGEPEPEFIGQEPNRFPDAAEPEARERARRQAEKNARTPAPQAGRQAEDKGEEPTSALGSMRDFIAQGFHKVVERVRGVVGS